MKNYVVHKFQCTNTPHFPIGTKTFEKNISLSWHIIMKAKEWLPDYILCLNMFMSVAVVSFHISHYIWCQGYLELTIFAPLYFAPHCCHTNGNAIVMIWIQSFFHEVNCLLFNLTWNYRFWFYDINTVVFISFSILQWKFTPWVNF